MKTVRLLIVLLAVLLPTLACRPAAPPNGPHAGTPEARPLPTGLRLDPVGRSFDVGNMPLAIVTPPGDPGHAVVLLAGWRQQGLQVIDLAAHRVTQTVEQPAAFLGLAFSPDGHTLYASGGSDDAIFRYRFEGGTLTLLDRIGLAEPLAGNAEKAKAKPSTRFPAGLALSPDGATLYVAENLGDALAVVDLVKGRVVERHPTERFPYGVVTAADGTVYVSAWGGTTVSVLTPPPAPAAGKTGRRSVRLVEAGRIAVGRHPSALLLNAAGSRLFVASASTDRVAVVDTAARKVLKELLDPPPTGPAEGCTPDALALSLDGARLYVAEADANAVAVFDLAAATSGAGEATAGDAGDAGGAGDDRLAGRIPTGWYPTALLASGRALTVVNGKGKGTGPNPDGAQPGIRKAAPHAYTLGQLDGTVTVLEDVAAATAGPALAGLTKRVIQADRWDRPRQPRKYPPFEHVVYVIKENRTYDQVLGDLPGADGDPGLTLFPRAVSPNHHALAERFGLFDRFFVNAEVSTQGHSWSTASYVTDYGEKTTPSGYSDRRPEMEEGDADEPDAGFLWNLALAKGLEIRDYGEATTPVPGKDGKITWTSTRPGLGPYVAADYPGWDLDIPDQKRANLWLAELDGYVKRGKMPALEVVWLPSDHTSGATPGKFTPRSAMADNDYALGRIVEGLSQSPFFKSTVVFVLEDDAQNGPDHVDSHRSVLLVLSPYNRPGAVHRFVNTTDVMETIEEILGLPALSHYDHFGRPLDDLFTAKPDLKPYSALLPEVTLGERNPPKAAGAAASLRLDLSAPDRADEAAFNRILWTAVRGAGVPYPKPGRVSVLELERGM
jgi:DNA-binding beta-propeller fold protein YncE